MMTVLMTMKVMKIQKEKKNKKDKSKKWKGKSGRRWNKRERSRTEAWEQLWQHDWKALMPLQTLTLLTPATTRKGHHVLLTVFYLFDCLFVCSFVRSFVCLFVCLFRAMRILLFVTFKFYLFFFCLTFLFLFLFLFLSYTSSIVTLQYHPCSFTFLPWASSPVPSSFKQRYTYIA